MKWRNRSLMALALIGAYCVGVIVEDIRNIGNSTEDSLRVAFAENLCDSQNRGEIHKVVVFRGDHSK